MTQHPLRFPLLANATFSAATGAVMLFGAEGLGGWLGPDTPMIYALLGGGLLAFAIGLVALARWPRPVLVVGVLAADLSWVLGTSLCLGLTLSSWTMTGVLAVALTNAIVGVMIVLQARGLRRVYQVPSQPGHYEICVRVGASVPAARLWPVIADLGAIADHMSSLTSSKVEGAGEGSVRTCEDTRGHRWSEQCIRWVEGESFDVRFLTDRPGFPFPFSEMIGGWRLIPGAEGCAVEVWWRVVPRRPWLAPILLPLMAQGAASSFADVVASMVAAAEGQPQTGRPRLRAALC